MFVKLLPQQIPAFWETIKYAAVQADGVKENKQVYLNKLLHSLLNDKSQCFARLDDERKLLAVLITKIEIDKISGESTLHLKEMYSWAKADDKIWAQDFLFVKEFAEHEKCKYISFESNTPAVWEIGKRVGFKENSRAFRMEV